MVQLYGNNFRNTFFSLRHAIELIRVRHGLFVMGDDDELTPILEFGDHFPKTPDIDIV